MRAIIGTFLLLASLLPGVRQEGGEGRARELVERVIANQHRNDRAIYGYERVQRRVSYDGGSATSEETYRLVPTGTGHLSLLLKRGDKPVSLSRYQEELRNWQSVLRHAIDPNDPREVHSEQVRRRRDRKRAELIDDIGRAFHFTWLGEETVDGRRLAHIALEPDPSFQPDSRESEMLRHVHATAWIDEEAAQLARGKAEITSDVSTGGGIIGKIYRGGWFEIEQTEVAPAIWQPSRMEFSIRGRMFLFSFDEHKLEVTSRYRHVGSPRAALEVVGRELRSGEMFPGDR